ncbi:MAG: tetratricopeptide repeat protein [Gemmatimonadaceae bacterium]
MARLDELERKFEENPRRYFAPLANEYRKAGEPQRAAELCRSQLPDIPGHISGHIVLGQALFDSRDFAGSRAALETALALDPENIVALRYLGDIARDTGDAAEADRWYSRTLEADPYNEAATAALASLRESASAIPIAEETPAPAPDGLLVADVEATIAPHPPAAAPADGFEPTSYSAGPESAEPDAVKADAVEPDAVEPTSVEAAGEITAEDDSRSGVSEDPPATPQALSSAESTAETEAPSADDASASTEFAGDLEISAASEPAEQSDFESSEGAPVQVPPAPVPEAQPVAGSELPEAECENVAPVEVEPIVAVEAEPENVAPVEVEPIVAVEAEPENFAPVEFEPIVAVEAELAEVAASEVSTVEAAVTERFDVEAHAPPELIAVEEATKAEERVMESAAPFVTETMADLYMEQGYPHEALELLLQLSEQRPQDEQLRSKIEHIESVIVARRDAAVAAARAERAETSHAAEHAEAAVPEHADATLSFELPPFEPAIEAPVTVREIFARMDRARPRPPSSVTPRPLSRLRSDFVPMPESGEVDDAVSEDPFAFPNVPVHAEERPAAVPRSSGPHPIFNPSTAETEDFDAWLRGLKGP